MIKGILAIGIFVWVCVFAIIANQDAALSGKYDQADQFLYSLMSR